jgi:hypothetical protein
MRYLLFALLAALLVPFQAAALEDLAEEPRPTLRFDPFAHPEIARGSTGRGRGGQRGQEWAPVVKATLVAGSQSMANLGGVILRIGEETHGYRLIEVREREAVFERGESSVVLSLEPEGER